MGRSRGCIIKKNTKELQIILIQVNGVTDAIGDRWGKVRRAPVQGRRKLHHMA